MSATVEINDAVFCEDHLLEVCEDCSVDLREENEAFYGFDSIDRAAIKCPPVTRDDNGVYQCDEHQSAACPQCFIWKKLITRARAAAKKANN